MRREITTHHTNEANKAIRVTADEPDPNNGNASHLYELRLNKGSAGELVLPFRFQHGPIAEVGVNGITNEVLLAIVIDRLTGFQSSKYACEENEQALQACEEALGWLEVRTKKRERRGVEGTHTV
jgi:hypothetical protein